MNRFARFIRTAGGFVLLTHIGLFFCPFLVITQENYPTQSFSQFSQIKELFGDGLSGVGKGVEQDVLAASVLLIVLPVILSVFFGIWGIAGSRNQIVSGIGGIVVSLLDAGFLWKTEIFSPVKINEMQEYQNGIGFYALMAVAFLGFVIGIGILVCVPGRKTVQPAESIPDVAVIREEQLKPKYEFVDEAKENSKRELKAEKMPVVETQQTQSQGPRGMMIGLAGVFQGAEISFQPGETLKLGRDNSNDLIFTNSDKVSRCHCEITWLPQKNKFRILDYSSNGCFVNGREECIPQNIAIELELGTILDVGDQSNRFQLV